VNILPLPRLQLRHQRSQVRSKLGIIMLFLVDPRIWDIIDAMIAQCFAVGWCDLFFPQGARVSELLWLLSWPTVNQKCQVGIVKRNQYIMNLQTPGYQGKVLSLMKPRRLSYFYRRRK
jgi:hypothetical protein